MEFQSGVKIVAYAGFLGMIYSYTSSKRVEVFWETETVSQIFLTVNQNTAETHVMPPSKYTKTMLYITLGIQKEWLRLSK